MFFCYGERFRFELFIYIISKGTLVIKVYLIEVDLKNFFALEKLQYVFLLLLFIFYIRTSNPITAMHRKQKVIKIFRHRIVLQKLEVINDVVNTEICFVTIKDIIL